MVRFHYKCDRCAVWYPAHDGAAVHVCQTQTLRIPMAPVATSTTTAAPALTFTSSTSGTFRSRLVGGCSTCARPVKPGESRCTSCSGQIIRSALRAANDPEAQRYHIRNGQAVGHTPRNIRAEVEYERAMRGLVNVMAGVLAALAYEHERAIDVAILGGLQRFADQRRAAFALVATPEMRERMSAAWTAEVRKRVKALPPPGPRVYCQPDDDD